MPILHIEVDIEIPEDVSLEDVEGILEDFSVIDDDAVYNDYIVHMGDADEQLLGEVVDAQYSIIQ